MSENDSKAKAIFWEALKQASNDKIQAYVEKACAADGKLLERVNALLSAHQNDGQFLDMTQRTATASLDSPAAELVGTQIGPYKLIQLIGEGGMGVVYMAQQYEPVERRVALKIIKPGMDTRQVIARFEAERKALAMMDHPNIAKVLDAGTTENGHPYFVMELVKGIPVTKYCDEKHLTTNERLELFIPICRAVQHAHHKGIIHRDLKPSNVLIALYDGNPIPKVIDFGVAKAVSQKLTEKTLFTQYGQIVGTIEYMSPEQAELNQLDIDTRSDIYSLGVLLYELLTGETPFDKKRLRSAAFDELLRIIREEEPPKPSTKLSSNERLASVAANRRIEPKKLSALVRGDLDWIVMKAIEKDRARRYETANGFARDIERFLNYEPVDASPPSALYKIRKFARKYRRQVVGSAVLMLALVVGIAGTSWGLMRALRAESLAEQRFQEAETARAAEETAKIAALAAAQKEKNARTEETRQRQYAEAIADFVKNDFLALTNIEARFRMDYTHIDLLDKDMTLRELIDRATEKLDLRSDLDPHIESELQWMIGANYVGMGEFRKAIPSVERSLELSKRLFGADHDKTLKVQSCLGVTYMGAGLFEKAVPLFDQILKLRKMNQGEDHLDTLTAMNNVAGAHNKMGRFDKAVPIFKKTLAMRKSKLGDAHPDTLNTMGQLATAYLDAGDFSKAVPLLEQTMELSKTNLGDEHPNTVKTMNGLALAYLAAGQSEKAIPLLEQALAVMKANRGDDHPETARIMNNLAGAYDSAGEFGSALHLWEKVVDIRKSKLGNDHPATLTSINNLAGAYKLAGQLEKAIPMYEKTLELRKTKLGIEHPQTLSSMINLATAYRANGQLDEAQQLLERALVLHKSHLGDDHPQTLGNMFNLAAIYAEAKDWDRSLPLWEKTLAMMEQKLGRMHPRVQQTRTNLAFSYYVAGLTEKAIPLLEEVNKYRRKQPKVSAILGKAYIRMNRFKDFNKLVERELGIARQVFPAESPQIAGLLAAISRDYLEIEDYPKAEKLLRESLQIREKKAPDVWSTFNVQSMLGGAIWGQAKKLTETDSESAKLKFAEAEKLLLDGFEGIEKREDQIPPGMNVSLEKAIQRLIDFYESRHTFEPDQGYELKASEWKQKLDQHQGSNSSKQAE